MNPPDPASPSAAPPAKAAPLKPTGARHRVLVKLYGALVVLFHRRHRIGLESGLPDGGAVFFGAAEAGVFPNLASFSLDLTLPLCRRTAMDVGGKSAGTVSDGMNTAGRIGGAVGPVVVGCILQYMNRNWTLTFALSAAIYAVGGLCWAWIDPVTPVDKGE
jgi:MFS family permease